MSKMIKHVVVEMDESMVQHCILCGAIICDYRNSAWPIGQPPPRGFDAGDVFVLDASPRITTIIVPSDFQSCSDE